MRNFKEHFRSWFLVFSCVISSFIATNLVAQSLDYPGSVEDSSGNRTAIWQKTLVTGASTIYVATKTSSGSWSSPVAISDSSVNANNYPQIVMNASGQTVAFWIVSNTTTNNDNLYASMSTFGGSWSTPVFLSDSGESVSSGFSAKINDNGDIMVTWQSFVPANSYAPQISVATASFGGSWASPVVLGS